MRHLKRREGDWCNRYEARLALSVEQETLNLAVLDASPDRTTLLRHEMDGSFSSFSIRRPRMWGSMCDRGRNLEITYCENCGVTRARSAHRVLAQWCSGCGGSRCASDCSVAQRRHGFMKGIGLDMREISVGKIFGWMFRWNGIGTLARDIVVRKVKSAGTAIVNKHSKNCFSIEADVGFRIYDYEISKGKAL